MESAAARDAPAEKCPSTGTRSRPYLPRRPQASPLYRVLADHFEALERVHEERFEPTHGPLRAAARRAAGRFLDCGLLEHGFARVRCGTCRAEFLVAFRCKGRHFCPSCHARRVAEWSAWLDEQLLARVAHRQVVLTVPKRLRAYFVRDPRRLGLLSRIATRTLRAYVQAAVGEPEVVPGLVVCVQTFGSVAHFHPHLHVLMTDGAYRNDGTFVALPEPEPAVLEELWRRTVLAEFVRRGWLEEAAAAGMMSWPHSGFGAYVGPRIEEREGMLRVARYAARAPVAESRLRYHADRAEVELVADRVDGPYAGVHRMAALEFVARWVTHVPERYEVRVRYAGAYATRRRVWWRRRGVELAASAPVAAPRRELAGEWPALKARRKRWAELLRMVFQVEVEVCPRCGGEARIIAFVTEPAVVRRILAHLERRGVEARAGPWAGVMATG
jgi:hypothetical protein